ncbi:uncharacterized protein LOC126809551 [Patella vulgata]|uniref:uncharacterized protein LOC126809551 n=1 Tax=Patella vulgata TaxID=6465 RepID=UPI0024A93DCF|nr:uncharacterized protein LOC126809551 [Patella vulgata]
MFLFFTFNFQMVKHCNCEVRKFPYNGFPPHLRNLTTYAWKPIIIQMALQEHHFVAYMDASIRLKISDLTDLFQNTKDRGFMYLYGDFFNLEVMQHTDQRMLQFFRLDGCKFLTVTEKQATMVLIADKWLSHFILMKWWVVCALTLDCIAPPGTEKLLFCDPRINKIGKCHRFDQSALNLIIYSIFNNPENHVISRQFINTKRGQMVNYFEK